MGLESPSCLSARKRRRCLVFGALVVSLLGCCVQNRSAGKSGIEGVVLKGPMCPGPARADRPCPDQPVSAAFQVLDRDQKIVATFQSSQDGHFHADLAPGYYTILPEGSSPARNPLGDSAKVAVQSGLIAHIRLYWDTGMR
jgi:hypothetical protein